MRSHILLLVALLFGTVLPQSCLGQSSATVDAAVAAIHRREAQGPLVLRDYSAAPVVKVSLQHGSLQRDESFVRSFSVLKLLSVSAQGTQVIISGTKKYVLKSSPTELALFAETEPFQLVLNIAAESTEQEAQAIPELLFFPDLKSALKALPEQLKGLIPGKADLSLPEHDKAGPRCDCAQAGSSTCPFTADLEGYTRPKLLKQTDFRAPPELASKGHLDVVAVVTVNVTGRPSSAWLVRGSSESAVASVTTTLPKWQFSPATCHGTAIADTVEIVTNYRTQ